MKECHLEKEFEEKYELYANMLYKIAFLHLNNASDAEDVLQDVFAKYLYFGKRFSDAEHEKAWFIRATQNKCLDKLRKAERKNTDIDDLPLSVQNTTDLEYDIVQNILKLPPKYKTVVVLHYYNGYSIEEISGILKISKAAVKKRLQRGREKLRLGLEDYAP